MNINGQDGCRIHIQLADNFIEGDIVDNTQIQAARDGHVNIAQGLDVGESTPHILHQMNTVQGHAHHFANGGQQPHIVVIKGMRLDSGAPAHCQHTFIVPSPLEGHKDRRAHAQLQLRIIGFAGSILGDKHRITGHRSRYSGVGNIEGFTHQGLPCSSGLLDQVLLTIIRQHGNDTGICIQRCCYIGNTAIE